MIRITTAAVLTIVVATCALLASCRFELATDPGSMTPTTDDVRSLLADDRVRQALSRATELSERYRDPQTELALAWALWRNGEVRSAETHFRRAAVAGLDDAVAGLAAVRASVGDWEAAEELARRALDATTVDDATHALIAGLSWVRRDQAATVQALRDWGVAEAGTVRGRAGAAMAAAVERLQGPLREWGGEADELPLRRSPDGHYVLDSQVNGQPVELIVDLTFRQSVLAPAVAADAGLVVVGEVAEEETGRYATDRWPSILSPRQAAVTRLDLGNASLRNVVVAVAQPPAGADGVLAMDLLAGARWTLDTSGDRLVVIPPARSTPFDARRPEGVVALAWMQARLIVEGLAVQMLLFPRVLDQTMASGLDLAADSRLDSDLLPVRPGSNAAMAIVSLGGWRGEALWRHSSLAGWAADGGVAPPAVLGRNLTDGWTLHWFPDSRQLRIDRMTP